MSVIMVIEDNPDNMDLVTEILEDEDYTVEGFDRARPALARLQSGGIDLILMDISLPDLNGLEATRLIRQDQRICHIPVLALTAHAMANDERDCLDAGCDAYLTKPIDDEMLLQRIAFYLEANHA
ncbi:MAG: response regulator [Mariprofundus sp.]|nr:response regulator [Mariprofundus sp.]